ncbi:MAG: exosortase-associated EpsI family protein [Methanophagales archaeon]|nr:exosortase-associated EpsI family protein [Methanophagales archaeon]
MKTFIEEYCRIIGLLMLGFVFIFLLSSPSTLFAKTITTIDTELSHASKDAMPVRAKMDFGNNEHMRAFPNNIGGWVGSEHNTTRVAESLGADVMLMRNYVNPETFQPVIFLIVQSKNHSSFHPPIVCYPALGYTIEEEGKAWIPLRNLSWVGEPLYTQPAKRLHRRSYLTIPVKKLIVVKKSNADGKVTQRRVVLYFYVKESPFSPDTFTMIRVSALAPAEGSYDGILNLTTEFMGNTIPCMFELRKEEPVLLIRLASGSVIGKVAIGLLLLVPIATIFYPQIKRRQKSLHK